MAGSAPCANSRPPRPLPRNRHGPAPIRIATPLAVLLIFSGCSIPSRDALEAGRAAERWLAAVASRHGETARRDAVCRAPGPAFRGGTVLRVGPVRLVSLRTLDSLAAAAGADERHAAMALARADEETADSLWLQADAASRRAGLLRDARRAAAASGRPGLLRACRVRVRIRWGGPLVGPAPVDREHVLRALAAPGGRWIVYSWLARDRDPARTPF